MKSFSKASIQFTFANLALALWALASSAAPSALDISKLLNTEENDVYFSDQNFKISPSNTEWMMVPVSKSSSSVQAQFVNPKQNSQAKMTVRSETLNTDMALQSYVGRSVRDYNRFGFEILAQRPLKINDQPAYLVDLKQNDSPIQLRQILFKNKKSVVILTCSSHQDSFKQELKACNQIYRNFRWL